MMRNLIISFCMIFFFGFASAQETPAKKKQSTDTIQAKKSKHTSTQKSSNTRKGDTVYKQRSEQKKGKTVKPKGNSTPQSKDSITGKRS
ncbi:hypothetical protein [Flavobacterium panacagri]|uniref:hypothetical protein n=1 Tax=Flavobacterium panacagri TaxID=3034146 RepID=UPI0025A53B37|nr:hypothetical protein [Flavobacterium panacagri]